MAEKGFQCVLSAGGSTVAIARSATVRKTFTEQEITSRASAGFYEGQAGIHRLEITVDALYATDSGRAALQAAASSGSSIAFVVSRGDGSGYSGYCLVPEMSEDQPIDGPVVQNYTLRSTGTITIVAATTTTTAGA